MAPTRTLLATAEPTLDVSALGFVADAQSADVLTGQASLDALVASGARYSAAVVACGSGKASLAPSFLGGIAKLLAPGSAATVRLGGGATQDEAKSALLLSGFVDCGAAAGCEAAVSGSVPAYGVGAKASLLRKPKATDPAAAAAVAPAAAAPVVAAAATWQIAADEDGDEELVDEEELLTEEDRARPAAAANGGGGDDCEVGKGGARKACKDCTCGRAEAEAAGVKVQLTEEMLQNPGAGSCGNCSLGDAFRCAGCPYRGLPSFEPGKPLTLPADFLVADT